MMQLLNTTELIFFIVKLLQDQLKLGQPTGTKYGLSLSLALFNDSSDGEVNGKVHAILVNTA